jgi:soluble lytic murein transglycosylase
MAVGIVSWLPWKPAQASPLELPAASESSSEVAPAADPQAERALVEALDAIAAQDSELALSRLAGLETRLPILADQVLMAQAIAYEQANSPVSADRAWTQLLSQYPDSPLMPRALMGLGRIDELRSRFPRHPVTAQALWQSLETQPTAYDGLHQLAEIEPDREGLTPYLKQWEDHLQYSGTASDWQVLADTYWALKEYGRASRAYAHTPRTPQNLYRLGRSHQISDETAPAIAAYNQLVTTFLGAPEVGEAQLQLAELLDPPSATAVLRQAANGNTPSAPVALQRLASLYDNSDSSAAETTRQELWQRFPHSLAAAEAAWDSAFQQARTGQLTTAIAIARPIAVSQPDTEEGAQLQFWIGKWQTRLGNSAAARDAYRAVLQSAPQTYYAWRAAQQMGLPVGDFSSGRLPVEPQFQLSLLPLPAVSPAVQQLHLMGAPNAAWTRWQWETAELDSLSTPQAFASGVLRNLAGDRLEGINQVDVLRLEKNDPVALELSRRPDFWQTIYPLPYFDSMAQWTQQYSLNPLVLAGLIRQESRFEPEIVSSSGALGLTQVMPSTGAWIAEQLGQSSYQLTNPEDNLRFGAWYLDYTHRTYQNNSMLAIASYNAGPGNVAQWVESYGIEDPDEFVERIPFEQTRHYVKAVFGNYWNYLQLYSPDAATLVASVQDARR